MGLTIAQLLTQLNNVKLQLKSALEEKGIDTSSSILVDYPDLIRNIETNPFPISSNEFLVGCKILENNQEKQYYNLASNFFNSIPEDIREINFINLNSINQNDYFYKNINLIQYKNFHSVCFNDLITIGGGGLYMRCGGNKSITSLSFPKLTTVYQWGLKQFFETGKSITSINFPKLTTIYDYGMEFFIYKSKINLVNFPELTTIGSNGMNYCFRANVIIFPKLINIGKYAFSNDNFGKVLLNNKNKSLLESSEGYSSLPGEKIFIDFD